MSKNFWQDTLADLDSDPLATARAVRAEISKPLKTRKAGLSKEEQRAKLQVMSWVSRRLEEDKEVAAFWCKPNE